jgi:diguanylate cyclase (GGDEF)-like protein
VFRDSDVWGRLGGDEFVVLLTSTGQQAAAHVVAKLHDVCAGDRAGADEPNISFSHGIVQFDPERHASLADFLAEGDAKMYAIKRSK